MIRLINLYSNNSKLLYIHPIEKLVFVLISLIGCSYTENFYMIALNIVLFIFLNIFALNPWSMIRKFIGVALIFAISTGISMLWQGQSSKLILLVMLRGINGAITISFLALTTPIDHLVYLMSKYSVTRDIGDIIKSMERFIILLEDDVYLTFTAIRSRGGFGSFKNSVKDYGRGFSIIFKNVFGRWREMNMSLKNRCYIGKHSYINNFNIDKSRVVLIGIYFLVWINSNIFTKI